MREKNMKYWRLLVIVLLSVLLQSCFLTVNSFIKEQEGTIPTENEYAVVIKTTVSLPDDAPLSEGEAIRMLRSCSANSRRYPEISFYSDPAAFDGYAHITIDTLTVKVEDVDKTDEIRKQEEEEYERIAESRGSEKPEEPDYTTKYIVTVVTVEYSGTVELKTKEGQPLDFFPVKVQYAEEFLKSRRRQTGHKTKDETTEAVAEALSTIIEAASSGSKEQKMRNKATPKAFSKTGDMIVERLTGYFVLYKKTLVHLLKTGAPKEDKMIRRLMAALAYRPSLMRYLLQKAETSKGQLKCIYYLNVSLLHRHAKKDEQAEYYYNKAKEHNASQSLLQDYETAAERL